MNDRKNGAMNTPHDTPADDSPNPRLDAALDTIRQTIVPAEAVQRVTSVARRLSVESIAPVKGIRPSDRFTIPWPRRALALTAGLLALSIAALFVPGIVAQRRAAAAFAEVVERAKEATSARFSISQRWGQGHTLKGRQLVAGRRTRYEMVDAPFVMIIDLERGRQLTLDTKNKLAELSPLPKEVIDLVTDPVEQLSRVAEQGVEPVPGEPDTFRGKGIAALGQANIPDMVVVVDHDTRLPNRIVIRDPDPKHPFEVVLADFQWDAPFDESLLSIDLPDGYTTHEGLVSPVVAPQKATPPLPPGIDNRVIHDRVPAAVFWSVDGTRLTTLVRDPENTDPRSSESNMLRQWDLSTGALRWSENVLGAGHAAMTGEGRFLADVVGYEIQLRDAETGATNSTWTTKERLGPLAFSPDGTTLAAGITEWGPYGGRGGAMAGGIEWWNVADGTLLRSIALDRPTTHLAWSSDSRWIAASSNEGPVRLIDAGSGEVVRDIPGRGPLAFSSDGAWLACVADGDPARPAIGRVSLHPVSADAGTEPKTLETAAGRSASTLLDLAFSHDDVVLVAADWNGDVTLWDLESGRVVTTLRDHGDRLLGTDPAPGVHVVTPSPDGQTLATGGEDGTVRLWSPGQGGGAVRREDR